MSEHTADRPIGASSVARGRTHLPGWLRASGALGCCMVVAGVSIWALWPKRPREADPGLATNAAWNMGQTLPEHPFRTQPVPPVAAPPIMRPSPVVSPVEAPPQIHAMQVWEDANAASQAAQQVATRATLPSKDAAGAGRGDPDVASPGGNSEYAQRMQTTRFADTAPMPHRFHVHYTIKKGTIFPCTPAQPISSSLPGPVQCSVDQDVWSMDGTTILLPRGTQVNGSVERGLSNGEERLFLVWTDALTPRPDLLAIPLDAPAADELGQTGVPGDVNDHLWKRIKTALLLSAVDIAGSAITSAAQNGRGNQTFNLGSAGSTANSLGQMAFGRDLNIPPTLYRGPGQPLTVYVNKYVDLFRFYENRVRY